MSARITLRYLSCYKFLYIILHFILQLENDAENWHFFKMFAKNLVLKKNIVPHKNVQNKSNEDSCSQFSDSDKKRKLEIIEEFTTLGSKRRLFEEVHESTQPKVQDLETTMKNCAIQGNLRKTFRSIGIVAKPDTATSSTNTDKDYTM